MYKDKYAINFFKADQDEMQRKTQELSRKMIELIVAADFSELGNLQQECKQMRYSAQGYLEESEVLAKEKNTLVNIGYVIALLDIIKMYLQKLTIQNEMQQIKTKYKNTILSILARSGTMLHKDLASAIGVSASGLTAIIKQMNATSVQTIHVQEVSKFKLYSITPAAYKYAMYSMPELLPEIESKINRAEMYINYAMEVKKIIQNRKMELMEKESRYRTEYVWIRDTEKRKYSEKQKDFNNVVEFGRKLA
ncbi:MAG: hypothetical protein NC419_06230 [Muribaculaceae bacterium]|nr:hypothetical protein [Muribaculaceae bacterium]